MQRYRAHLHCSDHALKYVGMLMFTDTGPRSLDDRDVIAVYHEATGTSTCNATVILVGGGEVSGRVLITAVHRIEREIAEGLLPPEAA